MNKNLELLKIKLLQLVEIKDEETMFLRLNGLDWNGYTMVGIRRLDNIEKCILSALENNIPGCIVETGVWRGGACIFANGVLKEAGVNRNIYVCDIFDGTFPDPTNESDQWVKKHDFSPLSVSEDVVRSNFEKFDLLTDNIIFKKGWFKDTLPQITEPIAILRLDGDTYQSTMEGLQFEPLVSKGGFIIMDDWAIESSRLAFLDYFKGSITEKDVVKIDSLSAYWQKL